MSPNLNLHPGYAPVMAFMPSGFDPTHSYGERVVDLRSPSGAGAVRLVEISERKPWCLWHRIALADGGWIKVIPVRAQQDFLLVHVAGGWAEAAGVAGIRLVREEELASCVNELVDQIARCAAQSPAASVRQLLRELGMLGSPWAGDLRVVDSSGGAVGLELSRDICATIRRVPGQGLALALIVGPTAWYGEGLEAREVDELLFELRTASNMRVYLDQVVQASEHRTHRLLKAMKLSEDAIASGCYGVVWVSRGSVDLHATADANISISLPAIDLPQLLRAKMRQVEVPLDGLCFTRGSGDALKPALGGFCVAAASPHGQWLASVSLDEMAVVLG